MASAAAQNVVSATFSLPDVSGDIGTTVCLPVRADDFTGGIEFSFALQTRPNDGVLTFNRVQNLNPLITNFGMEDFNLVDFLNEGIITVVWRNYNDDQECFEAPSVVNLPDGAVMFEVCYDVAGTVTDRTEVVFYDKPDSVPFDGMDDSVPIIFNKRPQCDENFDAFPGIVNGSVTVGVPPVILSVDEQAGVNQPGDIYCTNIRIVSGFTDIAGFQYGILYDSTVLRLREDGVTTPPILPGYTPGRYNSVSASILFGLYNNLSNETYTLADNTVLVNLCFDVVGDCGDMGPIIAAPSPGLNEDVLIERPNEANGATDDLAEIPIIGRAADFVIGNCNPEGFDVIVDCPDDSPTFGDTDVCVDIRAGDDFIRMRRMNYALSWNSNVLRFTDVRNTNGSVFINIADDYITDRTDDGLLFFDWTAPSAGIRPTLDPGEIVYSVCFEVVGFSGTSPVTAATFRNDNVSDSEGAYNGLNPTNCAITVQQTAGVTVAFPPSTDVRSSEDRCVPFTVNNFQEVTSFELNVGHNPGILVYRDFLPDVPGVTATELFPGLVQVSYSGPGTLNLPDGAQLGELCYRALEGIQPDDGICDTIGLRDDIIPSNVITSTSGGNSVTIQQQRGAMCVTFPNGYGMIINDTDAFIDSTFCVPVDIYNFNEVSSTGVRFSFNPALATFDRVIIDPENWPGLSEDDFNAAQGALGLLDLTFTAPGGPVTAPAGEPGEALLAFEICFRANNQDDCFDLNGRMLSDPGTVANGEEGSVVVDNGEVCLQDRIILTSIEVVPASCSDVADGEILFTTAPRPNNEPVFIRTENPVRRGGNGRVTGLPAGMTRFVIFTQGNDVRYRDSIFIPVDTTNAAVADAGPDRMFSCDGPQRVLLQSRNNRGVSYRLLFLNPDGTTRFVESGDVMASGNATIIASEVGDYIVEVRSAAGCTDRDTVNVARAVPPAALAGEDQVIGCQNSEVTIGSEESSVGPNVEYVWESLAGDGTVITVVSRDITYTTDQPGRYRLTVRFVDLGCSSTDEVRVIDDAVIPSSSLPAVVELNCDGSPLLLTVGEFDDDLRYNWYDIELGPDFGLSSANTFSPNEDGTYVVELVNVLNGCMRNDTVDVLRSAGAARVAGNTTYIANCDTDTVLLQPLYIGTTDETVYTWFTTDGNLVPLDVNEPEARVTSPGNYFVSLRNNDCIDTFDIFVGEAVPPTVFTTRDTVLSCQAPAGIEAVATSPTGADLGFRWALEGMDVPNGDEAAIDVDQPGVYLITVTDLVSGCTAIDSVEVFEPEGFPEFELADTTGGLGCDPDTVFLTVAEPGEETYTYEWSDPAGMVVSTQITAPATSPGTYTVRVTDPATGCTATSQTLVEADATQVPQVRLGQNGLELTCDRPVITLNASASTSASGGLRYEWETVSGDQDINSVTADTVDITAPGTYRVTVFDTETSCSASQAVTITENIMRPEVAGGEVEALTCERRMTSLSIEISGTSGDVSVEWNSPFMIEFPRDVLSIDVTRGGTYTVLVTDLNTFCSTPLSFRVPDLQDSIATIQFEDPATFDCATDAVTLDASATQLGSNGDLSQVSWRGLDGGTVTPANGSLTVTVNGAGAYELTIADNAGCSVSDTVVVQPGAERPVANAGENIEITCGEMPQLDGSASSPTPDDATSYAWSVVSGEGEIISGGDGAMPFVSGVGVYQLVVTNVASGCADSATVSVTIDEAELALLPADFSVCSDTMLTVRGNLPAGTTGAWTSRGDADALVTFDGDSAVITSIGTGLTLVWTLSQPGCPDYSSDSLAITQVQGIVATDDVLNLTGEDVEGTIDVTANDVFSGPVTVTLLGEPTVGEVVSFDDGTLTFAVPRGTTESTTLSYEICSATCPDVCATANILITASADGTDPDVYNAITPNGDGRNDVFVFELIARDPAAFPNRELVVFNRWGDVVFEQEGYNNDWGGTDNSGNELPEGTYYYVLRLDIGEGDIIRGDVTVLR